MARIVLRRPQVTIQTIHVGYERKFNLGDYNSVTLSADTWSQVADNADIDAVTRGLQEQIRNAVALEASRLPALKVKVQSAFVGLNSDLNAVYVDEETGEVSEDAEVVNEVFGVPIAPTSIINKDGGK